MSQPRAAATISASRRQTVPTPLSPPAFQVAQVGLLRFCIGFLYLFIAFEILELLHSFYRAVTTPDVEGMRLLLSSAEVATFAPVFLGILILLELIETLKVYAEHHVIRIQLVLLVGLTAMTRHLLASDIAHGEAWVNVSVAALIIALATAYLCIGRATRNPGAP